VAQHQQLGVLGGRTSRQQHKPPQHLAEQQVEQSKSHAPDHRDPATPQANSQFSPHDRLSGTHMLLALLRLSDEGEVAQMRAIIPDRH
jgi:hypothetical protein